ncbi:UNVERIFIED_CONTAM: hypothetical protein FKN15_001329 [Acipenser sinensis]
MIIQYLRSSIDTFWSNIKELANNLSIEGPALPQKCRVPKQLESGRGEQYTFSTAEGFYRCQYFEVFDNALAGLHERFDKESLHLSLEVKRFVVGEDLGEIVCHGSDDDSAVLNSQRDMILDIVQACQTFSSMRNVQYILSFCDACHTKLTGEAQAAARALSPEHMMDYPKLKAAILNRVGATPEGYRRKFREAHPRTIAHRLKDYALGWLNPDASTKARLVEVIVVEHFLECLAPAPRLWVQRQAPATLDRAVELAEQYQAAEPTPARLPGRIPALRRSRSGAFGVSASALGAALRRFVQRFCAWCLVLLHLGFGARRSTFRRSVHAPRRSTLGAHTRRSTLRRFDARYTYLDARCTYLAARCTHLNARRFGARRVDSSTLGARTSTLDASALDARCFDAWCSTHLRHSLTNARRRCRAFIAA